MIYLDIYFWIWNDGIKIKKFFQKNVYFLRNLGDDNKKEVVGGLMW
jgi:hypothetical protein